MNAFRPIVMTAIAYYVVVTGALHFLNPQLDPVRWPLSAYVNGPFGFLMTTTFFVLAIGLVAQVLAWLSSREGRSVPLAIGSALLGMAALGVLMAGVFPMDEDPTSPSSTGNLHNLASIIAFPAMAVAPLIVTFGWLRRSRSTPRFAPTAIASLLPLACLVMIFVVDAQGMPVEGLIQRLFLVFLFLWMVLSLPPAGHRAAPPGGR